VRVEEIITDRIIKLLEQGTAPWHCPWSSRGVLPKSAISQQDYHGINVVMLECAGDKSPRWLTFKQAERSKGQCSQRRAWLYGSVCEAFQQRS
jgi:antirestriction protein ArdC